MYITFFANHEYLFSLQMLLSVVHYEIQTITRKVILKMKPMNLHTANTTTDDTEFHTKNTTTSNTKVRSVNMTPEQFLAEFSASPTDIIGIDGPCGSGKSTLASRLSDTFGMDVIHLDNFFLPMELRTPDRLAEIGGNVHYERFLSQVIHGIQSKEPFTYERFDCNIMGISETITIQNNKPIVIEGSYCLRPDFRSIYTKKLFLTIDASTQKQRLIKRVGNVNFEKFQDLWIPKENAYFKQFHISEIADIIIDSQ